MLPYPIYIFILIELIAVSYGDIKYRKIPNLWSVLNLGVAGALFFLFPKLYILNFESFQYSLIFLFAGFMLFTLKIMGGGDSKFLATFFLIIPLKLQDEVFYILLLMTISIGILFLINNFIQKWDEIREHFKNQNIQGVKSCFGSKFAYAPVILLTWIYLGWEIFLKLKMASPQ